jgi:hypothetical protein
MTAPHDDLDDAYLWDPATPPSAEVQTVERQLEPLRFEPEATPLDWRRAGAFVPQRRRRMWVYALAAAAVLAAVTGTSLAAWRWSWPAGRPWPIDAAAAGAVRSLAVGAALEVPASDRAHVRVARIGTMQVEGDTRLTLRSTQGTRHRLTLDRGTVRVRVWAPPGSLAFHTPAGEVIDLGCEFDLTADAVRSVVRVRSGWVQLDNSIDESLVPAGATSEMRAGRAPGVAVFEDAAPDFMAAVRALEAGATDADVLRRVIVAARPRDVYTLLMLVARGEFGSDQLLARAADLWPPPAGVTVSGILRGDRDALWQWRETLPLPPPKGWLRNWRDALPGWLLGRR